jgi:hypothetical protein
MMENEEIMNSLHKPEQEYCMILSESMLYHPPITQALQHHDMSATVVLTMEQIFLPAFKQQNFPELESRFPMGRGHPD